MAKRPGSGAPISILLSQIGRRLGNAHRARKHLEERPELKGSRFIFCFAFAHRYLPLTFLSPTGRPGFLRAVCRLHTAVPSQGAMLGLTSTLAPTRRWRQYVKSFRYS